MFEYVWMRDLHASKLPTSVSLGKKKSQGAHLPTSSVQTEACKKVSDFCKQSKLCLFVNKMNLPLFVNKQTFIYWVQLETKSLYDLFSLQRLWSMTTLDSV